MKDSNSLDWIGSLTVALLVAGHAVGQEDARILGPGTVEAAARSMSPKDREGGFGSANAGPYQLGQDSMPQDGVPKGTLTKYHHKSKTIYPGVERDYWAYVPVQYDASKPACVMVFQDAGFYLAKDINTPVVFDNLIHKGEIPVIIGLFVNPGDKGPGMPIWGGKDNRSLEYDSLGDRYARFLIEELIPEVQKKYRIVDDPAGRATVGMSSGGIAAFTLAWERPDYFGKVISHCGSFIDIRGGHNYPPLIRKTVKKKPIRVFLQSGRRTGISFLATWPWQTARWIRPWHMPSMTTSSSSARGDTLSSTGGPFSPRPCGGSGGTIPAFAQPRSDET